MSIYSSGDNILSYIFDMQSDLWTVSPAIIESVNLVKQTVNCKLAISRKTRDGGSIPAAILFDVPILHSGNSDAMFYIPPIVGDMILVLFANMPVDEFLAGDGKVTVPSSMHYHNISDAFAITGVFVRKKPNVDQTLKDVPHIRHKNTSISFAENGDLNITSTGDVNLTATNAIIDADCQLGGAGGVAIGRVGDTVQVTVPIGTFLTSATGGVLNPAPVNVDGTITSGSANHTAT